MSNKLFDDFIREKIGNHVATVPVGMWDKIVQEKGKDKKAIYWWQPIAIVAVVGCMTIYFGWFDPFGTYKSAEKPATQSLANKIDPTVEISSGTTPGNFTSPVNSKTEKASTVNVEKPKENALQNVSPAITYNDNREAEQRTNAAIIAEGINTVKAGKAHKNIKQLFGSNIKQRLGMNNKPTKEQAQVDSDIIPAATRPYYDRYSLISLKEKATVQNAAVNVSLSNLKSNLFSSVDCPSDRRSGNHGLYFELYASPDVAFKQMEYKKVRNGINSKDSTSTKQLSYSLGFRLTKEIGQNLLFKTGLNYSQINERFDYRNENERTVSTVITIRTITNSNGTTTTIRDTSLVEQIGYRVKTTYNRYRSWDVPVLLGYEVSGEGWKANINGGAIFNLSSTQQGEFLDTSYRPASFSKSGPAIFKKKVGVGLYAGLSLIKEISNSTSFFAEPYLRYSLSDRTTNASPFTQRFYTAGILLGIRFKLNGSGAAK